MNHLEIYEDFQYEYDKVLDLKKKKGKSKKGYFPNPIYKCYKCLAQKKPLYKSGRNSEIQRLI
jgi:hypothetical protein